MKQITANVQWVFWINFSFRKWFKFYWTTRGANFKEIQIWRLRISIGRPWLDCYVKSQHRDYSSTKYITQTNKDNLKRLFAFKVQPKILQH